MPLSLQLSIHSQSALTVLFQVIIFLEQATFADGVELSVNAWPYQPKGRQTSQAVFA